MDKLNALAARAMGWKLSEALVGLATTFYFEGDTTKPARPIAEWSPSTCADDALMLLEKMLPENWTLKHQDNGYFCWDEPMSEDSKYISHAKTAPLAMTLCALRAAGIPESEITAAME